MTPTPLPTWPAWPIWLRSHDRHDLLAALAADGTHALHERPALGDRAPRRCAGFFALLGGAFVALYRDGGEGAPHLALRVGDACHALADGDLVEVSGPAGARVLVLRRGDGILARHAYALALGEAEAAAAGEQGDFGLLVANVTASRRRRDVLLGRD